VENVLTEKATRRNSWEAMPRARTGIRAAEATHNHKGRPMRKKFVAAPLALVTALALAAGPVSADETETETDDVTTTCVDDVVEGELASTGTENEPEAAGLEEIVETEFEEIVEAAEAAVEAAADIVEEEDDGCVTGRDRANAALQAAVARLSEEGAGGNGVAAQILTALLEEGGSPAEIGARHGEDMAKAAVERRAEREAASGDQSDNSGRPDKADRPESNVEDDADVSDDDTGTSDDDTETSDDAELSDAESGGTRGRPADAGRPEGKGRP
jgi:hypothetical protein